MSESYQKAGVDLRVANKVVDRIKRLVKSTFSEQVIVDMGHFGAAYDLSLISRYDHPIWVQSMDGVGTKLKIAKQAGSLESVGEDIVNHCCNDILCLGARPLIFLDYIAADRLNPEEIENIVKGISRACLENNVSLIGGETAEMPGVYQVGEHDIVGCVSGVVEKKNILGPDRVKEGDLILGLASNGLHTNGYSLVRKILFEDHSFDLKSRLDILEGSLGEELLRVHKSYVPSLLSLMERNLGVRALAHITGGGFWDNIPRILPAHLSADINKGSWVVPPLFDWLSELGSIEEKEMFHIFNMGVGLVLIVDPLEKERIKAELEQKQETVFELGQVVSREQVRFV